MGRDEERVAVTYAGYFQRAASQGCSGIKPSANVQGLNTAYFRFKVRAISCIGMRKGSSTTKAGSKCLVKSADQSKNDKCCSGFQAARYLAVNCANRCAPWRPGGWGTSALLAFLLFKYASHPENDAKLWNFMGGIDWEGFSFWTLWERLSRRDSRMGQDAIWMSSLFSQRSSLATARTTLTWPKSLLVKNRTALRSTIFFIVDEST